MPSRFGRRRLLVGALAAGACLPLGNLTNPSIGRAEPRRRLVIVRSLFGLRRPEATSFEGYLAPLRRWSSNFAVVQGLRIDGDGSEYHNAKQTRFATSCAPTDRDNRSMGGGAFDGKSVDVVVGEHLQRARGSRHPYLILGAYPYTDPTLHVTFESFTFANRSQYVRPQYDLRDIREQIFEFANVNGGGEAARAFDLSALEHENRVLEAVMMDIRTSSWGHDATVQAQSERLQRQYGALLAQNLHRIGGAAVETLARDAPLDHDYERHSIVPERIDQRIREMNYTAALALRTNFSSVVSLNYNLAGQGQPEVPPFHMMTHPDGFTREPNNDELETLDGLSRFQIEMFAHLLEEMSDLGVLEDSLIVYSPHERPVHNHEDVPLLAYGADRTGSHRSELRLQDFCRDVLMHFEVQHSADFGGETSRGGVLV
ncbi:MAG: DUF1552 domain-containing protein [Myxococcota bacterium]